MLTPGVADAPGRASVQRLERRQVPAEQPPREDLADPERGPAEQLDQIAAEF